MRDEWLERSEDLKGEVLLEIIGGQGEITTKCKADCYYRNGSFYLLFQENIAEDGKKGEITFSSRLKISQDQVILRRAITAPDGSSKKAMEMTYRKQASDERGCVVDYPTPYGILRLEISTKELSVELGEGELNVDVSYLLLQEGQEAGGDQIRIRVRK